jgi:CRISPR-associated protein Cmr2
MNKYLGITIGPIYNTILQARKTREFWQGSYFFSYVMKLILRKVTSYGDVLAQDISQINTDEKLHGAGIYSDRCFVKLENDFTQNEYKELVDSVINELVATLGIVNEQALRKYLQIYCACMQIEDPDNPIEILNKRLDVMELQASYNPQYLYAFHAEGRNANKSILPKTTRKLQKWYDSAFDTTDETDLVHYNVNGEDYYSFPSLIEITTKALQRKFPDKYGAVKQILTEKLENEIYGNPEDNFDDENEIIKIFEKDFKEDFKMAHKYAVIAKADADNMGKLLFEISGRKDKELLQEFSKKINDFSRKAAKLITLFGGKPIYIGGDDLLFFSPVVSANIDIEGFSNDDKGNIFRFIQILDEEFRKTWDWDKWGITHGLTNKPALSYGLSITYYKYPLKESMELSDQLLKKAKDSPGKNTIAIQVMTHSGKIDKVILSKHKKKSFDILVDLLDDFKDKTNVIRSVTQRLRDDECIIKEIGCTDKDFDAYFKNEYDTDRMADSKKRDFIEHSSLIFNEIFRQHGTNEAFNQLCAIFRLLNFLTHE